MPPEHPALRKHGGYFTRRSGFGRLPPSLLAASRGVGRKSLVRSLNYATPIHVQRSTHHLGWRSHGYL